ncbi:MAG: type II toxin-antitoxin system PemK/MazF family toxin [Planctomycetia bacterium]|nr:type II toxin-antitoxin system PemK/MazF family toxin [Planctomycetia bacterium]
MVTPASGEVVVVPFPFSDLAQSKVRPAVCLADAGRGDFILCQVTSQPYGDPRVVALGAQDFVRGGLRVASFARPGKLFTANRVLLKYSAGKLSDPTFQRLLDAVVNLLRAGKGP